MVRDTIRGISESDLASTERTGIVQELIAIFTTAKGDIRYDNVQSTTSPSPARVVG